MTTDPKHPGCAAVDEREKGRTLALSRRELLAGVAGTTALLYAGETRRGCSSGTTSASSCPPMRLF